MNKMNSEEIASILNRQAELNQYEMQIKLNNKDKAMLELEKQLLQAKIEKLDKTSELLLRSRREVVEKHRVFIKELASKYNIQGEIKIDTELALIGTVEEKVE